MSPKEVSAPPDKEDASGESGTVGWGMREKPESSIVSHREAEFVDVGGGLAAWLWLYPGGSILAISLYSTNTTTIIRNTNPTRTMASLIRRLRSRRSSISISSIR